MSNLETSRKPARPEKDQTMTLEQLEQLRLSYKAPSGYKVVFVLEGEYLVPKVMALEHSHLLKPMNLKKVDHAFRALKRIVDPKPVDLEKAKTEVAPAARLMSSLGLPKDQKIEKSTWPQMEKAEKEWTNVKNHLSATGCYSDKAHMGEAPRKPAEVHLNHWINQSQQKIKNAFTVYVKSILRKERKTFAAALLTEGLPQFLSNLTKSGDLMKILFNSSHPPLLDKTEAGMLPPMFEPQVQAGYPCRLASPDGILHQGRPSPVVVSNRPKEVQEFLINQDKELFFVGLDGDPPPIEELKNPTNEQLKERIDLYFDEPDEPLEWDLETNFVDDHQQVDARIQLAVQKYEEDANFKTKPTDFSAAKARANHQFLQEFTKFKAEKGRQLKWTGDTWRQAFTLCCCSEDYGIQKALLTHLETEILTKAIFNGADPTVDSMFD